MLNWLSKSKDSDDEIIDPEPAKLIATNILASQQSRSGRIYLEQSNIIEKFFAALGQDADADINETMIRIAKEEGVTEEQINAFSSEDIGEFDHKLQSLMRGEEITEEEAEQFVQKIRPNKRIKTIRNTKEEQIGRNTACPCGSGKKYKKCCMRNEEKT